VDKKKLRKITQEHFLKLPQVEQLIKIFEIKHNDVWVTKVWFLKKKDKGDRFEKFHYDYKNLWGGRNDVSFTVVVNLGKLNDTNEIAMIKILSQSNEEPSVLTGSRREEMMQKLSQQEKDEIARQWQVQRLLTKVVAKFMSYD
jgi:hypothetical protein